MEQTLTKISLDFRQLFFQHVTYQTVAIKTFFS